MKETQPVVGVLSVRLFCLCVCVVTIFNYPDTVFLRDSRLLWVLRGLGMFLTDPSEGPRPSWSRSRVSYLFRGFVFFYP